MNRASVMYPNRGPPAGPRPERLVTSISSWLPSKAHVRWLRGSRLRPSVRLHVTCTAVEQDTEHMGLASSRVLEDLLQVDVVEMTTRRVNNRKLKGAQTLKDLRDVVIAEHTSFDHANTSHALARLARTLQAYLKQLRKAKALSPQAYQQAYEEFVFPTLQLLDSLVQQQHLEFEPWDVASCLWSYATLNRYNKGLFELLCHRALQLHPVMKPVDCANIMVAFGRYGHYHPSLLKCIPQVLLNQLQECKPCELSQVMWGFGRLGIPGAPGKVFMEAVADVLRCTMPQWSSQELINMLWSLARLGHYPGRSLLQQCEGLCLDRMRQGLLNSSDVSQLLWAMGKFRYKAAALLDELPLHMGAKLPQFSSRELVSVLCGYTHARHFHRSMLEALAPMLASRAASNAMTPQELTVCLWAYGIFQYRPASDPMFLDVVSASIARRARQLRPIAVSNIVKALGNLQHRPEALLKELAKSAEEKMPEFRPDELSAVLYGLSTLQYTELSVYYAAVRYITRLLEETGHRWSDPRFLNHRIINSIVFSCMRVGYAPWSLVDFAEAKGLRVVSPLAVEQQMGLSAEPGSPASVACAAGGPSASAATAPSSAPASSSVISSSSASSHTSASSSGHQQQQQQQHAEASHPHSHNGVGQGQGGTPESSHWQQPVPVPVQHIKPTSASSILSLPKGPRSVPTEHKASALHPSHPQHNPLYQKPHAAEQHHMPSTSINGSCSSNGNGNGSSSSISSTLPMQATLLVHTSLGDGSPTTVEFNGTQVNGKLTKPRVALAATAADQ